jgi:hypothetical protein
MTLTSHRFRPTRRAMLAGLGAGALVLGAGARTSRAAWGEFPSGLADVGLPPERRVRRVLELFMYGGMNAWDTLYCVPGWGAADHTYLHAVDSAARFAACGLAGELTRPFAEDDTGTTIHLGPWTHPLWQRPDVLARTRVVLVRHDQLPHETAIPLTLSGRRLGDPALAGTGAAVQRHYAELEGSRRLPWSYVLRVGDESRSDNLAAATAVGLHPAGARPLEIRLAELVRLGQLLRRDGLGEHRDALDALVARQLARYEDALRRGDRRVRAPSLDAYAASTRAMAHAPELRDLVPPEAGLLTWGSACGEHGVSTPSQCAALAAHLLTLDDEPARYVQWIDRALLPTTDGGHDTHRKHAYSAAINYPHTFEQLLGIINTPSEHDPGKLDLDDTLIAVTTEFGRSPALQPSLDGLNHWPHTTACALIGGPVDGSAVVGYARESDGVAAQAASPAELRAALLLALGVYPFDAGGLATSDIQGSDGDPGRALARLAYDLLGVRP